MRPIIYSLIGLIGFGNGACAQQVPSSVDAGQTSERLRMDSQNLNQKLDGVDVNSTPDNLYTIEKSPKSGSIKLDQQGHGNKADLKQDGGTGNKIDVQQSGKGNSTTVHSSGSGNSVIIRQSGE